jgi:hypothetical protein
VASSGNESANGENASRGMAVVASINMPRGGRQRRQA